MIDDFIARDSDGRRVTLRVKRDDGVHETAWYQEQVAIAERQNEEHLRRNAKVGKSFSEVMADRDAADDPRHAPVVEHHASKIADLLVESGRHPNRAAALDHLLHSARGAALLRRVHKHHEEEMTMTSVEKLEAARVAKLKSLNPVAVAKVICDDNSSHGIDEHEFTKLVTAHAQREHPDMTPEQAFVKVFTAQTEEGALLRKAHAVTKDLMSLEPVFVGGEDARDVDGAQKAYSQLMNMAEEQRARAPWKTVAQLFSELMQDPKNV